jgi:hypothetical protein
MYFRAANGLVIGYAVIKGFKLCCLVQGGHRAAFLQDLMAYTSLDLTFMYALFSYYFVN